MQLIVDMSDPQKPRRSTESQGLGQSGYTAGRREGDPALEQNTETRGHHYPRGFDERMLEFGLDDRWTGRGGRPSSPDEIPKKDD